MKKIFYGILAMLILVSINSTDVYARDYEKEDERYEKELAEETEELERFVGLAKDVVWQTYCTELWQILKEDTEDFDEGYITENTYEEEIGYTQNFSQRIQRMSEDRIKGHELTWTYGVKDGVNAEETRYYRLNKALEYYLQMQIAIGEPVIFDYTEYEQALFDEDAKNGIKPDVENSDSNEEKDVTEEIEDETKEEDETIKDNKKEKFISFLLGGGITLIVTVVLGVILLIISSKKRKEQFE